MSTKWIIGYGLPQDHAIVYAQSLEGALAKAWAFSQAQGLSIAEAHEPDVSWVEPFDPWLAKDLGLIWLDENERGYYEAEARQ